MATPTTTPTTNLRIDVDLERGMITKIADPTKNMIVEEDISLKPDDLVDSKAAFNEKFEKLNQAPPPTPPKKTEEEAEGQGTVTDKDDEIWHTIGEMDGGAFKRRLSRRRPRGSNRKKSLVRNKSKKMRRGKYSRKAK